MEESTIYRQIDLIIQEFICKIDQYTLTNLLNIINEFMELLDYSKKIKEETSKKDLKLLNEKTSDRIKKKTKNKNDSKVLINYLFLSSLKIYLTIRLNLSELYTTGFIKIITRVLGSIGNSLTRFTDVPLLFTEKGFENVFISLSDMLWIIYEEYKSSGTRQILTVLGSSDLIGNPVKLLEGIGTGFYELINEPRKGFIHGPLQFGKGIAKGLGKLLSGIIGGAFGVVESITGTLYSATQSLMGSTHKNYIDEDEGPNNIATGAIQGLYGGFKELANGITGVVLIPIKETKKHGVSGFFKGLGKGFIGLVISPVAALLRIVHSLAIGTKNTINYIFGNSRLRIKRFRYPRVLLEGNEPLRPYEFEKAEAKEALYKIMKYETNDINFSQYFCCADKGFDKALSLLIKTDKIIAVLYEGRKAIFVEKLKNIKKVEIHYIDQNYIIKFCNKKGGGKGFKVKKDYFAVISQIYDIFSNIKNKESENKVFINNNINDNSIDEEDKFTIIEVNDKNEESSEENDIEKILEKKTKKEEVIKINNIYNINNINNIYNINNFNNIQNIYNNESQNNNNINQVNNESIDNSMNQNTVKNDNSVFFTESSRSLGDDKQDKQFRLKTRQLDNSSIRSSINAFNSKDKFLPKRIFNFSENSYSK